MLIIESFKNHVGRAPTGVPEACVAIFCGIAKFYIVSYILVQSKFIFSNFVIRLNK
jgi:hypothetical protein